MPTVSIFSGTFCNGLEVARAVAGELDCRLLDDEALIAEAAAQGSLSEAKLRRAMSGKESVFNRFSREKERGVALLKVTLARLLQDNNLVFHGFGALLVPRDIGHVLDVCLIAETSYRLGRAAEAHGLGQKEAQTRLRKADQAAVLWADYLWGKDPWSAELYDILIPMDKTDPQQAVKLICDHARSEPLQPSEASRGAAADFLLAAQVEQVLVEAGHDPRHAKASAQGGKVRIEINKKVVLLGRLEEELAKLARKVPGVAEVAVEAGPGFYQADVYRQVDLELPSKVLLVDDEREFVQTLSERLLMREIGSAVVYDGEEALRLVAEDEPEVMVLDLKMPGIDGIEVLKRIKKEYPQVEVIILTGHGSEEDRDLCMQLGAFAYLQKPVDIEKLSDTMKQAYEKIRREKA